MSEQNEDQTSRVNKDEKLSDFVKKFPSMNEKGPKNKNRSIFYRGHSDIEYKLTPNVLRNYEDIEDKMYVEVLTECAHEFKDLRTHNEILSKMQHYGVPTRMLDITENALVALYFACKENKGEKGEDGVVYIMEPNESEIKQYDSDSISILSCLPRFTKKEKDQIRILAHNSKNKINTHKNECTDKEKHIDDEISKFNENKIIRRLLHEIKKEKPAFENIIDPRDLLSNYYFIPQKSNARIIRQSGAFIIFGLDKDTEDFRSEGDKKIKKIYIDKEAKQNLINQLANFGITEASLFPELYKVAKYIKNKYKNQPMNKFKRR